MQLYLPLVGIALGLAVMAMFLSLFFGGRRPRNHVKLIRKPTSKAGRYPDRPVSSGSK